MTRPKIEILTAKTAVQSNTATELLVLVRVTAPIVKSDKPRPQLNLGLVLDRSGSMQGEKLAAVKRAAIYAIRQMEETDRMAITIFDDEVETIVPSTRARDKAALVAQIERVRCGGSTALHAGWLEGATQVAGHLEKDCLNRVLLLTDGLANQGETNSDRIATDVKGLASRGVSTTAMGVGDDFNEDLLEQMAKSGDGNYYFIEGADSLEAIFAAELSGLMATTGRKVSLGIEPQNGAEVTDVLSDLEKTSERRLKLSNLVSGNTLEVVFKLRIPPTQGEKDVCFFRLAFDGDDGVRQVTREALSLSGVSSAQWESLESNSAVNDAAARLEIARHRETIARHLDEGDVEGAREQLGQVRAYAAACLAAPAAQMEEAAEFDAMEAEMTRGNSAKASKISKFANYRRRHSQS